MAQTFTLDPTDVKISDVDPPNLATLDPEIADFIRNGAPDRSPRSASKRERVLRAMDQYYGPLALGHFTVSRVELHLLNATVDGAPLDIGNSNFRHTPQEFIDGLRLNAIDVEQRIWASGNVGDYTIPTLLFEIATHRSVGAPPLFGEAQGLHSKKFDRLLHAAQKLDIRDTRLPENVPSWVNKQKSKVVNSMGVGLQAFGIYSGLIGISDAIKRGDRTEAAISAGAVVTEVGSLIIERGLVKTAQELIENSARIYQGFARTQFGLYLARGAGLIAGVLTLPFDIYFAIKALNDASQTTGKQALDFYVAAGLNLTSAALTLILGTAAIAGFAHAGPVGIAAAAILITGSQIYSAVRQVDDIDDYIELSVDERLVTGFLAFINQKPPQRIHDRHTIAVATDQHSKMLGNRARKWLKGEMKDTIEAIVHGKFEVGLKAAQVFWFEWDAQGRESTPSKETKVPSLKDGDDTIDARHGVPADLSGVVKGSAGESKATLWLLGGGNDTVVGVEKKPNHFSYGSGIKHLTGGEKDDQFLFEGAAQALKDTPPDKPSHLRGGDGNNTLVFQGQLDSRAATLHKGFEIDLQHGGIGLLSESDSTRFTAHTTLENIENVETLAGASNIVKGTANANRIVSRGHDRIDAGAGDDTIYLMGGYGQVAGGAGNDQYVIAHKSGTVTLIEDPLEDSVIIMDWAFENIQKWSIENTSLVVSSLCGKDGEWPEQTLVIKDVYKTVGDKRQFQEHKLRFLTADGFQLTPDLPGELTGTGNHILEVLILVKGTRPAPMIMNGPAHELSSGKTAHYFIDRDLRQTVFNITKKDDKALNTLHIDCESSEMIKAQATYTVDVESRNSNHYLNYGNFNLTLHFNNKTIELKNLATAASGTYTNVRGTSYLVKGLALNQSFNLTLRDGESYRIKLPSPNYLEDVKTPGVKLFDGRLMLEPRNGRYLLLAPEDSKPIVLKALAQRVEFPASVQNTVTSLEGMGATYHVYLNGDTILRIATPGAVKQISNASTWQFYSRALDPAEIKLAGNKLLIGRTIVYLPQYKSDDIPVEQIYVITASGVTYAVDLIFEQVYLHTPKLEQFPD
ncbi:calcium-binding protein [Pseudomonas sp. 14P_8.1_Bac3]|uniref:calcium-binding protein n=1 Tax=Pseudomonas sp. 14P_8.1_Bac3 TaxID=2971621 RepID=UPI0021C7FFC9|nr:calcium-binding protein [Pseudomonas sp. 14P_8.1_Bac3]MCU1760130.1 calcium-binding protein [Pseudomonas sp. 14P_8.1_Bac3]